MLGETLNKLIGRKKPGPAQRLNSSEEQKPTIYKLTGRDSKIEGDDRFYQDAITTVEGAFEACSNDVDPIKPDTARWFIVKEQPDYTDVKSKGSKTVLAINSLRSQLGEKTTLVITWRKIEDNLYTFRVRGCNGGKSVCDRANIKPPILPENIIFEQI